MAAMSRSLSKYLPSNAPVTYVIFGACCALYGISLLLTLHSGAPIMPQSGGIFGMLFGLGGVSTKVLLRLGASLPLPLNLVQPWRFVTACFLHANVMHIGFNMWVLIDLAPVVEELYGSGRFLFLYMACGIGGYVLSSASPFIGILRALHLANAGVSIGASGAIVGLIGVLLAITYRRRGAGMQHLRSLMYRWIVYLVLWGLFFPGIDNMAHLGGGITGLILGKIMLDSPPQRTGERKSAYALGWVTAIVILLCFGVMALWGNKLFFLR